jgi:hypothetical protein
MGVSFWPKDVARQASIDAFSEAFGSEGFEICSDSRLEEGFEKIAIYAKPDGTPTHAARQRPNGDWTSKLGMAEDIEHELTNLEGKVYGTVRLLMKRRKKSEK